MKNFQIRFSDELYTTLKQEAKEREASLVDIVREALELHLLCRQRLQEGKKLVIEDPETGHRVELIIPAIELQVLRRRKEEQVPVISEKNVPGGEK